MFIKTISLTRGSSHKVGNLYLKPSTTVTVEAEKGDTLEELMTEASRMMKKAHLQNFLEEARFSIKLESVPDSSDLLKFLKGLINANNSATSGGGN